MARKTWLQLVNAVLVKLREDTVVSVSTNTYSKLIGALVNEAKREVEDSYAWNALKDSIAVTTVANTLSYSLTNAGQRFSVTDVINDTSDVEMIPVPTGYMNRIITGSTESGDPAYYNFNGTDSNGDVIVDIYPLPDAVYSIYFNLIIPQADLAADATGIYIPDEPVILNAYARALVERGEDGGLQSSEAYQLYRRSLANHIMLDIGRQPDELIWVAK